MFTGQDAEVDEELNKKYYSTVDKKYVFTTRASMTLPVTKKIIKTEEYEEEEQVIEGEGQEGDIRHSNSQHVKDKFKKYKEKGFASKKYFTKKNKDKDEEQDKE